MDNLTGNPAGSGPLHTYEDGKVLLGLCIVESCMIVIANTTVFVLVIKYKKLRRKNNYCLISLAISDFLTGLLGLPLVIACAYSSDICTPMDLTQRFLSFSTILHLLVATGERYFKIRYPLRYKYYVTGARIGLVLVAVWVLSLALSLIQLTWIFDQENYELYDTVFSISGIIAFAFFPFLITVFANVHVLWIIRKESKIRYRMVQQGQTSRIRKSVKRRSNERKAIMVYLAMTLSFMVGFLPYFVLTYIMDDERKTTMPFWANSSFLLLKYTAPLLNPMLYTFFKTDFKSAFNDMVSKPQSSSERTVQTRV